MCLHNNVELFCHWINSHLSLRPVCIDMYLYTASIYSHTIQYVPIPFAIPFPFVENSTRYLWHGAWRRIYVLRLHRLYSVGSIGIIFFSSTSSLCWLGGVLGKCSPVIFDWTSNTEQCTMTVPQKYLHIVTCKCLTRWCACALCKRNTVREK